MQIASALEREDRIFGQSQIAPQVTGITRQALAMIAGVGIARFHAQCQGKNHGLGVFQLVGKFLDAQQRFDAGEELFGEDRLAQELVGAGLKAADAVFAFAQAGDDDHGNEAGGGVVLEFVAEPVAAAAGQDDIEQHQVGRVAMNHILRSFGAARGQGVIAAGAQQLSGKNEVIKIIVNDQDSQRSAAGESRGGRHHW